MITKKSFSLKKTLDKIFKLKLEVSEDAVIEQKAKASKKVEEVRSTLEQAGKLQNKIMQKTTTYYLGKAIGAIK